MKTIDTMPALAAAAAFVAAGCGGGSVTTTVQNLTRSYEGTQAPGDVWTWTLSNGTFTASDVTKNYTYSGTESLLPDGFLELTMQATTDPNVTVGEIAYAIELPNTALILQMAGSNTQPPIAAGALGSNPPGPTITYNYVKVPAPNWTNAQPAAGYVTFAVTGNSYSGMTNPYSITGSSLAGQTLTLTCTGGQLSGSGSSGQVYNGAVAPSGVLALDAGPNKGGLIGVQQPATAVSTSALGSMTFHGFLVEAGKTEAVQATPNGDGTLTGQGYSNVQTGTFEGGESGVTASFGSQLVPGLVQMNIQTSGGAETILCCVNVVGGKTMILGFGAGSGSGNPPYNVMMIQE